MKNYERFISNSPKHIVSGLASPPTDDGDHPDHDVGEEADPDHRAEEGQHDDEEDGAEDEEHEEE